MPLFPTRRYSMASIPGVVPIAATDQYDPLGIGQTRRRGGLFGGRARGIVRREDGDPGTFLNYALFGRGGVQGMRDDAMRRDLFDMSRRNAEQEAAREAEAGAAREAAVAALPEDMRPFAPLLTNEAISNRLFPEQEEPNWQTDAQGRPYTIENGQVRFGEGRIAVPPRGNSGVSITMPQTAIQRLAEQYVTTGVLPPGIARNARLAAQVYAEADAIAAQQGLSPQDQAWRGANYQANAAGLRAMQRQRTLIQSFERTALSNLELALQLSREVPRSDYPLVNQLLMTGQRQTGNTEVARYVNALIGARTEYAKVLSGATGAAGLTDSARAEAEEMFSTYATPDQIEGLVDVARQEMHNRIVAFDEQEAYLREQMTGQAPDGGGHGGGGDAGDNRVRVGNHNRRAPARPPGVPPDARWDEQTRTWRR